MATESASSFQECLTLLQGPTDERRCVGLLLVTKVLPQGADKASLERIIDAVGMDFILRLLAPLDSPMVHAAADMSILEQHCSSCSLGLAILSLCSQISEVATLPDVIDKVPALLGVVSSGGVTKVVAENLDMGDMERRGEEDDAAAAADQKSVKDALDIVYHICSVSTEAQRMALSIGLFQELTLVVQKKSSVPILLTAVRLLNVVLSTLDRAKILSRFATQAAELVVALAYTLALPPGKIFGIELSEVHVHLEALYTLLLLLPPPRAAHEYEAHLQRSAMYEDWPAHMRSGLSRILKSRTGVIQRHSALQLAAAMTCLVDPTWLTAGPLDDPKEEQGSFFILVVEVVRIETELLLKDALATPDVIVPIDSTGAQEPARQRASRLLPACFELLEASVEALAFNEAEVSSDGPEALLPEKLAERAMMTIQSSISAVLQFCEEVCAVSPFEERVEVDGHVLLGAVRLISRFTAEAPLAFGERLRKLLPFILSVRQPRDINRCPSLPPILFDAPQGLIFFLPTLLQLIDPGFGEGGDIFMREKTAWLETLISPPVLKRIVDYVVAISMADGKSITTDAAKRADKSLLAASTLMLKICLEAPDSRTYEQGLGTTMRGCMRMVLPLVDALSVRPIVPLAEMGEKERMIRVRVVGRVFALVSYVLANAIEEVGTQVATNTRLLGGASSAQLSPSSIVWIADLTLNAMKLCIDALKGGALHNDEEDADEIKEDLLILSRSATVIANASPPFAEACRMSGWVRAIMSGEASGVEQYGVEHFACTLRTI